MGVDRHVAYFFCNFELPSQFLVATSCLLVDFTPMMQSLHINFLLSISIVSLGFGSPIPHLPVHFRPLHQYSGRNEQKHFALLLQGGDIREI